MRVGTDRGTDETSLAAAATGTGVVEAGRLPCTIVDHAVAHGRLAAGDASEPLSMSLFFCGLRPDSNTNAKDSELLRPEPIGCWPQAGGAPLSPIKGTKYSFLKYQCL